ncbi:MAG: 50S ribosomal protein L10 [Melioribacteraceae bacterium]|nr:50S ribosomal protein L10 [Melioribacteraceae bacterium]
MDKSVKVEVVSKIKELLDGSTSVYLVDYSGVSVEQISEIRRAFLKEGVTYKVFKNTLFQKAIEEVGGYDELNNLMVGMTGFAFAGENFVAPAKIIQKYNKEFKKFSLKGCYIESDFYGADKLDVLASMPTKDEVMSSIVGSIANPATGIVGAINAIARDLVSVIDEVSKTKAA